MSETMIVRLKPHETAEAQMARDIAEIIAEAVLAERERAARICDDMHFRLVSRGSGRRASVAYDLAKAIRSPSNTETPT